MMHIERIISSGKKYLPWIIVAAIVIVYSTLVFLSEGTVGGADDMTHFRYARYAYQIPYFFLHHWGKPFFTALASPFAQFGYNGIRIFNVLTGTAAIYFTFRTAKLLGMSFPMVVMFLLISSPLYTVLMLSGMTEILFSLVLILAIFLFLKKHYIGSAVVLSFIPFVRTEGVVIIPLFIIAYIWVKQWKAVPFVFVGFVFYSIVGSFYFDDILWVIHTMPYSGNARDLYGSGELLHYVNHAGHIFGEPLIVMILAGLVVWLVLFFVKKKKARRDWMLEMLVGYMPFFIYFAAHSYVWWKGLGNSVGLIRVIAAVMPSAALLAGLGWCRIMDLIPMNKVIKYVSTAILCLFLVTIPPMKYEIPVPLGAPQRLIKEASLWLKNSDYFENKIFYYDPFFCHFMELNPFDEEWVRAFVYRNQEPEYNIPEGGIVIWDAHFSPNEGRLPLERLMDNPAFRLLHVVRPEKPFQVLGGYDYEIYIFQRIIDDDGVDNYTIRKELLGE
jgi:hypothetical protein